MRLSFFLLLCLQLFLHLPLFSQTKDTTIVVAGTATDSVRQLVKKEFERYQDSLQALRIKQNVAKNGKSLDAVIEELEERKKADQRQVWLRIGFGVLLLVALIVALIRRRRQRR